MISEGSAVRGDPTPKEHIPARLTGPARRADLSRWSPQMDEAGIALTGLAADVLVCSHIARPTVDGRWEWLSVLGYSRLSRAAGGMPISFRRVLHGGEDVSTAAFSTADGGERLVGPFSSLDAPVRSEVFESALVQTVDFGADPLDGAEVFTAHRVFMQSGTASTRGLVRFAINSCVPVRRIICDVWVHREIRAECVGAAVFHPGSSAMPMQPRARAFDKIADLPAPTALAPAPEGSASSGYARMCELTSWHFARCGAGPGDFGGFRLDLRSPIWGLEHAIFFGPAESHCW